MRYSVTRLIGFCYGHRLLGYAGKCRFLHGHNGLVEVTVSSRRLDRLGMVMDFAEIKERLQRWIDAELDHRMILNEKDPIAGELERRGEPLVLLKGNPTAENIARHILAYARSQGLPVASVRLWETPSSSATVEERV
ncbi:MAG: 6-carboxytetrahydropterin synthase [Elusimicrobia bacterium]|nr:6-carboxytetrahydropterin synthase [Elusimicrobiota bacterium]